MSALELKTPPPIEGLSLTGGMWGISWVTPQLDVPSTSRIVAAVTIAVTGAGFDVEHSSCFLADAPGSTR